MKCPKCQHIFEYKQRSNQQNRFLWGCVYDLISEVSGYSQNEVHEICKHMFLKNWVTIKGKEYEITKSTQELSTVELEKYIEQIRNWAWHTLACSIPAPNEYFDDQTKQVKDS